MKKLLIAIFVLLIIFITGCSNEIPPSSTLYIVTNTTINNTINNTIYNTSYQSCAAGWCNDTQYTNTSLNVNIGNKIYMNGTSGVMGFTTQNPNGVLEVGGSLVTGTFPALMLTGTDVNDRVLVLSRTGSQTDNSSVTFRSPSGTIQSLHIQVGNSQANSGPTSIAEWYVGATSGNISQGSTQWSNDMKLLNKLTVGITNIQQNISAYDFSVKPQTGNFVVSTGGNVGIGIINPTQKLEVNGSFKAGNNINYTLINNNGVLTFVGNGSYVPYGNMYMEDNLSTIVLTNIDTYYPITANMSDGYIKGFTFQNTSYLNASYTGWYEMVWSISGSSSVSDTDIEGAIMVNDIGLGRTAGINRFKENGVTYSISGNGAVYLNTGDIVRLCLERESGVSATISVTHASLTLHMIGG